MVTLAGPPFRSCGSRLFAVAGERSVNRSGGWFGMRFRAKIVEMSGLGVVLHPGKMDVRLGSRVLYAADMYRTLGNPILQSSGMSASLSIALLGPSGARAAMGIRIFRLSGMSFFWGTPMHSSGTAFFSFCRRYGTGTSGVCRVFGGFGAGVFLH